MAIRQFNNRFDDSTRAYSSFLSGILRWRLVTVAIAIIFFGGSSLWMAPQIPQEILPRINTGQANLNAQFPPGTPLETNQKVMAAVDEIIRKQPETEYVFSTIGGSLFGDTTNANALRASSTITLKTGTNVKLMQNELLKS